MDFDLSKGAAPINRCILTDPIIYDPVQFHLFVYLLIKANHSDNEIIKGGKRILIHRGSTLSGRDLLSEHLHIKPSTVNKRLENLEKTGYIQIKSSNKYSIISINNYEQFTFLGLQGNNKTTTDRQQNNTINNDDNEKNVKKKN